MNKIEFRFTAGIAAMAVALAAILQVGCEDDGGATNPLVIEPIVYDFTSLSGSTTTNAGATNGTTNVTVTAGGNTNTVVFSVVGGTRDLSLPLEWEVSNQALGQIISVGGSNAVYVRTPASGVNVVTARDQYDSEGFATVIQ